MSEEAEANAFAEALLMPAELVIREWTQVDEAKHNYEDVVEEMAKRFQVSEARMAARMEMLRQRRAAQ